MLGLPARRARPLSTPRGPGAGQSRGARRGRSEKAGGRSGTSSARPATTRWRALPSTPRTSCLGRRRKESCPGRRRTTSPAARPRSTTSRWRRAEADGMGSGLFVHLPIDSTTASASPELARPGARDGPSGRRRRLHHTAVPGHHLVQYYASPAPSCGWWSCACSRTGRAVKKLASTEPRAGGGRIHEGAAPRELLVARLRRADACVEKVRAATAFRRRSVHPVQGLRARPRHAAQWPRCATSPRTADAALRESDASHAHRSLRAASCVLLTISADRA